MIGSPELFGAALCGGVGFAFARQSWPGWGQASGVADLASGISHDEFVHMFVDCVTIRPFFEDLLRLKRTMAMLPRVPGAEPRKDKTTVAA
ncbi:hypothetical protein [Enhygromyxa salina]|uniref:Uncharacterized protein n=1 Tax=Enhygromyxa salina TaxID=215803 RepID=A0A2S9YLN2_9BACT|nr:hypothetical protein [Enhygromyxa salina]PRQ06009.1 hypothetical protein ENSA7_42710 [Enhygromyxa salina]